MCYLFKNVFLLTDLFIFFFKNKVSVEETWNNIQQNVNEDETKKKENFTGTKDTENIKEPKRGVRSTPTMVFSVVGDSDSFVPKPWPKTVFQTALIEAAKSGGGEVLLTQFNITILTCFIVHLCWTHAQRHYKLSP